MSTPLKISNSDIIIPTSPENFKEKKKFSSRDSAGNQLTPQQAEYFKDSKVRDADGNLLVVYHGTDSDFTVFDKTKGRANMDIQGMFFSPWELDAQGYGSNVKSYYLNITNPAPEGVAYKALNSFKGQNNAGVKAREYLESLGYDGVNNGDEEYVAFNSNQIKLISNTAPTENEDIRYSTRDDVLSNEERIKSEYNIKKLNDYIHIQKQVNKTLRREGFFTNPDGISRTETNYASGMIITINQSGINETFNKNNYAHNSKFLKLAKLLTIKTVPEVVRTGTIISDDVKNIHGAKNVKFAYIEGIAKIGNIDVNVRLAIKKSSVSNKFWVHYVDIKENINELTSADNNKVKQTAFKSADTVNDSISNLPKSQVKFSDRDIQLRKQYEKINRQLERENSQLREDVKNLRELNRLQGKVTGGKVFKGTSIQSVGRRIMKQFSAEGK